MVDLPKTCPTCGAPVWSNMTPQMDCWWWGQANERMRQMGYSEDAIESFKNSGVDPPCASNHADWEDGQRRERNRKVFLMAVLNVLAYIAFWYTWKNWK